MAAFFSSSNIYWSLLLPFLVAVAAAGLTRLIGGPGRGGAMAGLAVPAGFLAGWILLRGVPALSPQGAFQQAPHVALAGLALGLLVVAGGVRRSVLLAVAVVFAVVAIWSAMGQPAGWTWRIGLTTALLAAAWTLVLVRLEARPASEPTAAVMLTVLAIGVGLVALTTGNEDTGRVALAVAAASAGFLAWNWFAGWPFLAPAVLGGGGVVLALATGPALNGGAASWALPVLLLVVFADGTAQRLPSGSGLARKLVQPLLLALVCLLPVALALTVAYVGVHMR